MPDSLLPQRNHLLAALTVDIRKRLFSSLRLIALPLGNVLYEVGDPIRHVYFPTDAIVSLMYETKNGASAEISMVGKEGLVGVDLIMGSHIASNRAIVQSAGSAFRLPSEHLIEEFNRHGGLLVLLLRYTQALITQMAQIAACNRHHSIDQQLCRWLLMAQDRLPSNLMTTTQQAIADMLGVRREGVTAAANKLQKLGVIEYSRGHIRIIDRRRLEQLSCECYAVVSKETTRLLPFMSSN